MTQFSAPLPIDSPCINVCVLDPDQVCVGCGRHIDEISAWSCMTPTERDEAKERAEARRRLRESERG